MSGLDRRRFIQLSGLVAGAGALGACAPSTGSVSGTHAGASSSTGKLIWWDQFAPIAKYEEKVFAAFAKERNGLPVSYTDQNPQNFAQALQLAFRSKQLPDVFTVSGLAIPPSALRDAGWFAPLQLDPAVEKALPTAAIVDGVNRFDGKTYALPILTFRSHDTCLWFNKDLFTKAGLDVANPPKAYDDVRAAARKIQGIGGGVSGWIAPINFPDRLTAQALQMAMAGGGSMGPDGIDVTTGSYAYTDENLINAIEFLRAMKTDGVLFPASTHLDARTARARWATGVAGIFFDGSYNMGVLKASFAQFIPKVGVGTIPVPDATTAPALINAAGDPGLSFWVAKTSKHQAQAGTLISKFGTIEGQTGIAEAMDQPPLLADQILDKAKVEPTWKQAVEAFQQEVFLAPSPTSRNPDVAKALAKFQQVEPSLGEIVQGAITGQTANWKQALKKLSADSEAMREKAIQSAQQQGAKVSADDWKFADWKRGQDYQTKSS